MKTTVKSLASKFGVEYVEITGLVKLLSAKGLAKEVGIDKVEGTKGKGSTIWELPEAITVNFNKGTIDGQ
jgi:hypothetical protein